MLGMNSFYGGAMTGVALGVTVGFLGVISYQITGTNWIDWSASKTSLRGQLNTVRGGQ